MRRRHVAILNWPGPVMVSPTLTVVSSLIRRGYRVTYTTSQRFSTQLSEIGAEVLLIPRFEYPFNQDTSSTHPIEKQYSNCIVDMAERTLRLVSNFYDENFPDLVLYDAIMLAGPVIAKRLGVPAIRMSPRLALDEDNLLYDSIIPTDLRKELSELREKATTFLQRHDLLGQTDPLFRRDVPTIYFYVPDIQLGHHAKDVRSLYAARCAAERPHIVPWASKCADNEHCALVSASTAYVQGPAYFQMCMQALAGLKWHSILAIGWYNSSEGFAPLPPGTEILQHVPQIVAMPHVDLFIGLGGMATTMEAMYHGLPMILLTFGSPEAEVYADNIQRHGLGIHLKGQHITSENLRESIIRITEDPSTRSNVLAMQRRVRRSPGGEDVVNWIEDYLGISNARRSPKHDDGEISSDVEDQDPITGRT